MSRCQWRRFGGAAALVALLGCGQASHDAAGATAGRAANGDSVAGGGMSGGVDGQDSAGTGGAVAPGGSAGTGGAVAPGGSAGIGGIGIGGNSGSFGVSDAQAIAGESFMITTPNCVHALAASFRDVKVDCSRWVFHFRAAGSGGLDLVAYGETFSHARLTKLDDAWVLATELVLTEQYVEDSLTGNVPEFTSSALRFQFEDQDGDGRANALRVEGPGIYSRASDDYSIEYPAEYLFDGLPDRESPTLAAATRVGPTGFASFSVSEPLAVGSRATLMVSGEETALEPETEAGVVRRFSTSRLLWPDKEGELRVQGSDLAGNSIDARSQVQVDSVPAPAPLDFESDVPFAVSHLYDRCFASAQSGPRDSYDALTALEGKRSFLVAWGDRVVLHVKRPLSASKLRLALRSLSRSSEVGPLIEVLVVGGTRIESQTPSIPFNDDGSLADGATPLFDGEASATETQELSFTLSDEGEDVLVSVEAPCSEGAWSFSVGAWLDDLRFE